MTGSAAGAAGPRRHELLDDAVFERMEGDDREPSARPQDALGGVQRQHKLAQFVVDGDAQRLERARRGVNARFGANEAGDEVGELPRGLEPAPCGAAR